MINDHTIPSIKPTSAPNNLDGIPNIIVNFNNFSNTDEINIKILKIIINIDKTTKKDITSYNNIFKDVIPLNIPSKLKNGKYSYNIVVSGFFNKKANITTIKNPKKETNSFVKPLLNPKKVQLIITNIITTSIIFIIIIPFTSNYITKNIKKKEFYHFLW